MNTINVVQVNDTGLITEIKSFSYGKEGKLAAEQLFLEIIQEDLNVVLDNDFREKVLDDGFYVTFGGGSVQLVHSS